MVNQFKGAGEAEGHLAAKVLPAPTGMKELGKENQLAQWRHRSRVVPLHMVAAALGINGHRGVNGGVIFRRRKCVFCLTRKVSFFGQGNRIHHQTRKQLPGLLHPLNCRI